MAALEPAASPPKDTVAFAFLIAMILVAAIMFGVGASGIASGAVQHVLRWAGFGATAEIRAEPRPARPPTSPTSTPPRPHDRRGRDARRAHREPRPRRRRPVRTPRQARRRGSDAQGEIPARCFPPTRWDSLAMAAAICSPCARRWTPRPSAVAMNTSPLTSASITWRHDPPGARCHRVGPPPGEAQAPRLAWD